MKNRLILIKGLLIIGVGICIINANGQTKKPKPKKGIKSESVYDYIDSMPVPDSLKNESILILGEYQKYSILKPGETYKVDDKTYTTSSYISKYFKVIRYKLNDVTAVERFSTYELSNRERKLYTIYIIKANGERKKIDLKSESITTKSSNSNLFPFLSLETGSSKVAIPGLEVGDMVEIFFSDYYSILNIPKLKKRVDNSEAFSSIEYNPYSFGTNSTYVGFGGDGTSLLIAILLIAFKSPHLVVPNHPRMLKAYGAETPEYTIYLQNKYATVNSLTEIETIQQKLPFEFICGNGAKKPTIKTSGGKQIATIEFTNTKAYLQEHFSYMGLNVPFVKLGYIPKDYIKHTLTLSNTSGKEFDEDDAKNLANKFINNKWRADMINVFFNFEKENKRKLKKLDNQEKLRYAYFYFKKHFGMSSYIRSDKQSSSYYGRISCTKFFQLMCDRYKIPYDILIYDSRKNGNTEQALSGENMGWGLLAHPDGKDIYLCDFTWNSEFNVPMSTMEGTSVYFVTPGKKLADYTVKKQEKFASGNSNAMEVTSKIKIDIANNITDIDSRYLISGDMKSIYFDEILNRKDLKTAYYSMLLDKIIKEDGNEFTYPEYFYSYYYNESDFTSLESRNKESKRIEKNIERSKTKNNRERFEAILQEEYEHEFEVKDVEVEKNGITLYAHKEQQDLEFSVMSSANDLINKFGENGISVNIGLFISEQLALTSLEDKTRFSQIDIEFTKELSHTIEFEIPAGYSMINLDDFNKKIQSEFVELTCTAKVEGTKLIINFNKNYKVTHVEKEQWQEIRKVLDEAARMFERKLLLEKK